VRHAPLNGVMIETGDDQMAGDGRPRAVNVRQEGGPGAPIARTSRSR
jgi:hypothetical protein